MIAHRQLFKIYSLAILLTLPLLCTCSHKPAETTPAKVDGSLTTGSGTISPSTAAYLPPTPAPATTTATATAAMCKAEADKAMTRGVADAGSQTVYYDCLQKAFTSANN